MTDELDAGLREAYGRPPMHGESVLAILAEQSGVTPRILLRGDDATAAPLGDAHRSRYRMAGELARGGMGVILKGLDLDLGRDVAMKVLRPEHAGHPETLQRFVEEAQIGGQLQHPGVVPVYELGLQDDQRPYFTMKLIQGRTLSALLKERKEPGDDRRRHLRIFEQICETVAYAHARGVIHRDLKPANVMVGDFGEVQVVDWGLAKILGHPERHVRTVRTGSAGTESATGSVMGTLAYMPPEQARGETARLDERSDVFALGAILCEILTGHPPYTSRTSEIFVQAAQGQLDSAWERLDRCGAENELVQLARSCLSATPEERPRDAGEVARQVTAHLAAVEERARQAEVEAARAKVRARAERKARWLTLGLAAAVLLAAGALVHMERERRGRARQAADVVGTELQVAEQLRGQREWEASKAAATRALDLARARGADPEVEERATRLLAAIGEDEARALANARLVESLQAVRARRGESRRLLETDAAYAAALAPFGEGEAAINALKATGIGAELAPYLDDWAALRALVRKPMADLLAQAKQLDPDPWRCRLRDARSRDELLALAAAPDLSGSAPNLLARALRAAGERDASLDVLLLAQRARPDDFWLNFDLGFELTLAVPPRWDEAIGFLRVALASRPAAREVRHQLGIALLKTGRHAEAAQMFEDALAHDPSWLHASDHVIEAHEGLGTVDQLLERYQAAAARDPGDWLAQYRLGRAREATEEWIGAEDAFRRAMEAGGDGALLQARIGEVRLSAGDLGGALAEYEHAIETDPATIDAHLGASLAWFVRGDLDRALEAARAAVAVDPYHAFAHDIEGMILGEREEFAAAEEAHFQAIEVRPDHGSSHFWVGFHRLRRDDLDGAIEMFQEAIRQPERNAEGRFLFTIETRRDPATARPFKCAVPRSIDPKIAAHNGLGNALNLRGRWPEAAETFRMLLRRYPGYWIVQVNLASVLLEQGECAEAADLLDAALAVPAAYDAALPLYYAGFCLLGSGRLDEAAARFREFAAHPFFRAASEARRRHWDENTALALELARDLPALFSGARTPDDPGQQAVAAWLCVTLGRPAAAARLFRSAFATRPELAGAEVAWATRWQYQSFATKAAFLAGRGLGADAGSLPETERAELRRLALDWMRNDLALWQRADPAEERRMLWETRWAGHAFPALARLEQNLADLPEDERVAWQEIWEQVDARIAELDGR